MNWNMGNSQCCELVNCDFANPKPGKRKKLLTVGDYLYTFVTDLALVWLVTAKNAPLWLYYPFKIILFR